LLGGAGGPWLVGLLLALGAGTSYAFSNLVTRVVQRRRSALWVTLAANSVGGFVVLLVIQLVRGAGNPLVGADAGTVLVVLAAGCVNALALIGIAQSLRHITVAASSSIQSATVVFSFIASVVIFSESAVAPMVVGVTAVAAGILIANLRRREEATPPSAAS
jgi:drug/metabolite transporter (DMT)-like permease